MDDAVLESILSEIKLMHVELKRLDKIEKSVKSIQKDVSDINKHIEKGLYVDLERVKERVTRLEQKIV